MGKRMQEVLRRRQLLLSKIADQRGQLSAEAARWTIPLLMADRARFVVRFLRAHPLLTAGLTGLVVVSRIGVSGMARAVWRFWRSYRFLSGVFKKITPQ